MMRKRGPGGRFIATNGTCIDSQGYPTITAGPMRGWRVHELVAFAKFGDKIFERDVVIHHKDDDKTNCHPDNLQLLTESEHNAVSAKQYWYLKKYVLPKERADWEAFWAGENGGGQTQRSKSAVATQ